MLLAVHNWELSIHAARLTRFSVTSSSDRTTCLKLVIPMQNESVCHEDIVL